jgi:hypothetical protein
MHGGLSTNDIFIDGCQPKLDVLLPNRARRDSRPGSFGDNRFSVTK